MQDEKKDESSESGFIRLKSLEEKIKKRRKKASPALLIFYIAILILVILLMLWIRSKGRFLG
ncbi:MAG: hypothetical protein ACPL7B_06875 [Candidatus Poribacteria bacterium]